MKDDARRLVVVTRLGVRFGERAVESQIAVRQRLAILKVASGFFVAGQPDCAGWIIETDETHHGWLSKELSTGAIPQSPAGRTVISRRGTGYEGSDLEPLALEGQRLLIVRLDSDDVYHRAAIDRALLESAQLPDGVLVDFPHGYLLAASDGRVVRHSYAMQGPFFGVTTTGIDLDGIHGIHTDARSGRRVHVVSVPAWTQTVHSGNDSTQMAAGSITQRARHLRRRWGRRATGRKLAEAPRFAREFIPVPRKSRGSIARTVDLERWL